MKIKKRSGIIVNFDRNKLLKSLINSGAENDVAEKILKSIDFQIYDGISTSQIYNIAFKMLKKESNAHAARYNLKSALQQLGPEGFHFEKFIARLFKAEAYETITNVVLEGKCVSHEVDVIIQKNQKTEIMECKFHSRNESNCDVKVPMYILSRFNDLKYQQHFLFGKNSNISDCWLVTNTRFTKDATKFGICSGLKLLSWDYPKKNKLSNKVDRNHLYPITCLTTLSMAEKTDLLAKEFILANELINKSHVLETIGIKVNRVKNIMKEVSELCNFN